MTTDAAGPRQLRRVLGLPALVLFGLVYLAVLTKGFQRPAPELGFTEAAAVPDETAGHR